MSSSSAAAPPAAAKPAADAAKPAAAAAKPAAPADADAAKPAAAAAKPAALYAAVASIKAIMSRLTAKTAAAVGSPEVRQTLAAVRATSTAVGIGYLNLLLVICALLVWLVYYMPLRGRDCARMTEVYGTLNARLSAFDPGSADYQLTLKDYYIKTAFNSCSGGSYVNDYVDTCSLKALIKQGVRCLDFEIYSIGGQPVVATATTAADNYAVKETFNYIPFAEVMPIVSQYAFSSSTAPNAADPMFLHLRIKSANPAMYTAFAKLFESYTGSMLGPEYSYGYGGKNLGDVALTTLRGKISVIVDGSNPAYLASNDFYEYVNMVSNGPFMQALRYYAVKFTPDVNELIEQNRLAMTLVMPDVGRAPSNPDPVVVRETGCQFMGVRFQAVDANGDATGGFFDEAGCAFVLKPARLRYMPVKVPAPPAQNPELSFATRRVASDYYQFHI